MCLCICKKRFPNELSLKPQKVQFCTVFDNIFVATTIAGGQPPADLDRKMDKRGLSKQTGLGKPDPKPDINSNLNPNLNRNPDPHPDPNLNSIES